MDLVLPDQHPTKQGLKQTIDNINRRKGVTPRPASNKTRIETHYKSRGDWKPFALPDQHPTKQGLKPRKITAINSRCILPDQHPTKQGLKLNRLDYFANRN